MLRKSHYVILSGAFFVLALLLWALAGSAQSTRGRGYTYALSCATSATAGPNVPVRDVAFRNHSGGIIYYALNATAVASVSSAGSSLQLEDTDTVGGLQINNLNEISCIAVSAAKILEITATRL